jgi:hypothetical protein
MDLLIEKKEMSELFYKTKSVKEVYYNDHSQIYLGIRFVEMRKGEMKVRNKNDKWKKVKYRRFFIHYFMFKENDWEEIKNYKEEKEFEGRYYTIDDYEYINNKKIVYCQSIYPVFCRIEYVKRRKTINIYGMTDKLIISFRILAQCY